MTSVTSPLHDTTAAVAVRARDVARHYGAGETAVHALRGVSAPSELFTPRPPVSA